MMSSHRRAVCMALTLVLWSAAGLAPGFSQIATPTEGKAAVTTPAPAAPASGAAPTVDPRPPVSAKPAVSTTEPVAVTDAAVPLPADGHVLHELSPWSMFLSADIVVKAVMVSLIAASLMTWTILFGKTIELTTARRRLSRELARMGEARMIADARLALGRGGLVADLLAAAVSELEMSGDVSTRTGIRERTESRLSEIVRAEVQSLRRGMGLLATIGSTAPFVGLFGTVWGIMNSFIGISKSQTTNLAVVAPGIAEALLATATGLVAAIPAVIIYNHFSRSTRGHQILVNRAVGAATRLLSRELDSGSSRSAREAE